MSFLKTFSTSAVLQDVQTQRIDNFPNVAREKSMVLFSQTGADAVFVVKYKPDAINDYSNIIAWESNAQLDISYFIKIYLLPDEPGKQQSMPAK